MELPGELKLWVETLSQAEKRFIKLLGKARSGNAGSQQLLLFDWMNEHPTTGQLPDDHALTHNLPTVSNRLKSLILDSLRLLGKEMNSDARLLEGLRGAHIMLEKKWTASATKEINRLMKLALSACRYECCIQCLALEQRLLLQSGKSDISGELKKLRKKEISLMAKLSDQQEVRYRHDLLCARAQQMFSVRNKEALKEIRETADDETVKRLRTSGGYVEQAMAVNILGMKLIFEGKPIAAIKGYAELLSLWRAQPGYQMEQATLLLHICRFFQRACLSAPISWKEAQAHLSLLPDFSIFPAHLSREYQRMLYQNQFSLALNRGNFDAIQGMIPQIESWLTRERDHLPAARVLALLHNMAIAEFLSGHFKAAHRFVVQILNEPDRKARTDIREFAIVFQVALQYELGDVALNEYLTRSASRYYLRRNRETGFEMAVIRFVQTAMGLPSKKEKHASLQKLVTALEAVIEQEKGSIPILGLRELHLWALASQRGQPLREVFLQKVKSHIEKLG